MQWLRLCNEVAGKMYRKEILLKHNLIFPCKCSCSSVVYHKQILHEKL